MKHILVIVNNYSKVSHNFHLLRLLKYLKKQGMVITLLPLSKRGDLKNEFDEYLTTTILLSQLNKFLKSHPAIIVLTKELRSEFLFFFYRYVLGFSGIKHYTIRPSFGFLNESLWKIFKNILFYVSVRLVDVNIAVSRTIAFKIKQNVVYIPNSVPSHLLGEHGSGFLRFNNPLNFIYSGNLEPRKNLLYALSLLRDLEEPYRFTILGEGPQKQKLLSFIGNNQIKNHVFFRGFVADVEKYLRGANVFLFLSKMEGLSLSLLEAMACGLPCIVSDIPENREIVTDYRNGILLPLNDQLKAVKKIQEVINQPRMMARMGGAARKTIASNYTDETSFQKYFTLLSQ